MDTSHIIIFFLFIAVIGILFLQFSGTKKDQMTIIGSDGSKTTVEFEIADTQLKKMRGLMFRKSLPAESGMLFIFDKPGKYSFWMANTTIPLDAIYFSPNGTVVDVISMDPCGMLNCPKYTPKASAQYILEVNQGFAKENNILVGKSKTDYFSNN
jgi:hypothetical protein